MATAETWRVNRPLRCACLLHWRAPYGTDHPATLPPGSVLEVHPDSPAGDHVEARPLPYDAWLTWLVEPADRADRRFDGLTLWIAREELRACASPEPDATAADPRVLLLVDAHVGCLLGTAVGDALGLPLEGLHPRRILRLTGGEVRHRLLPGTGMLSDDTEQSAFVAQALAEAGGDPDRFARRLARRLRWWLLGLPAGIGLATLRAIVKLWLGFPPARSGVWSAGNGAAMRVAIVGVHAGSDEPRREALVRAATRVTHTDPRAEAGAQLVAEFAALNASRAEPRDALRAALARAADADDDFAAACAEALAAFDAGEDAPAFCAAHGMAGGVSGFVNRTVPVAALIVLRHPRDFEAAIRETLACGGDTDTVAAIVGGIVGAGTGPDGIPREWQAGLRDWPRSRAWLVELAETLALREGLGLERPVPKLSVVGLLLRNLLFIVIVLAHGFRRLAPPYR